MAMTEMNIIEPYVDASPMLADPPALRRQAAEQGFLYLRGIVPIEPLMALRRELLELADAHGFVKAGTDLMDGIAALDPRFTENMKPYRPFYEDVLRCRSFHALAHEPALIGLFEALFDGPVAPHSRNIARLIFPDMAKYTTPPHQDFVHIRGTENTWTTWIPVGDMPDELGGLAIAEGTHKLGFLPTHAAYGAGGAGVAVPDDTIWRWSPLAAGDLLTFHSFTAHQGRDNRTSDRLRLSLDYRYQPRHEPIHPGSMKPHMGYFDWPDIYSHWPAGADPLQYYWQDWPLNWQDYKHE